jgi:hypothetical protein
LDGPAVASCFAIEFRREPIELNPRFDMETICTGRLGDWQSKGDIRCFCCFGVDDAVRGRNALESTDRSRFRGEVRGIRYV